jgi:hypothetical protein
MQEIITKATATRDEALASGQYPVILQKAQATLDEALAANVAGPFGLDLAPGTIKRLVGTAFKDARLPNGVKVYEWLSNPDTAADQPWPANAGSDYSIMRAENGAVFANGKIYITGGGHADGAHMGVYAFNVAMLKWERVIRHPQLFNGQQNWPQRSISVANTYNPDGSPVSRHTWGGFLYIPSRNCIWIGMGSTWPTGLKDPQRLTWFGDVVNGTWEQRHAMPSVQPMVIVGAVHRPPNKVIWTTTYSIYEWDLDTGVNVKLNGGNESGINNQGQLLLDEQNQKLYLTCSYGATVYLRSFDLTQPGSTTQLLSPTGDLSGLNQYRVGQWFSNRYGLVQWKGGNDLYAAPLPNPHFTKLTLGGDIAPPFVVQGMFGKFGKITEDGEYFYLLTEITNDVYVGRMP